MTEHETQALAALDRRGRDAGVALKQALAALDLELDPESVPSPPALRRNVWLTAAVILAVAGLVAAFLALRAEPTANVISGREGGAYLVPDWLPEAWELSSATDTAPDDPAATTGATVVYGDPVLADPWSGPQLGVIVGTNLGDTSTFGAERIELMTATGVREAFVREDGSIVTVEWTDGQGRRRSVAGRGGLTRQQVIAAATHTVETTPDGTAGVGRDGVPAGDQAAAEELAWALTEATRAGDPYILPWGLPSGFTELARGPLSASPLHATATFPGLRLDYRMVGSSQEFSVLQGPAHRATAAELLRLGPLGAQEVDVRGTVGYSSGFTLQWHESSTGMLVTILGDYAGLDTRELMQIAEGLRPPEPGELEAMLAPAADGSVVIQEGEGWRLVASAAGGTRTVALEADDGASDTFEVDEDWGEIDATFGSPGSPMANVVFGWVTPDAAQVIVEHDDQQIPVVPLEVAGIEGWNEKVFVAVFPDPIGEGTLRATSFTSTGEQIDSVGIEVAGLETTG